MITCASVRRGGWGGYWHNGIGRYTLVEVRHFKILNVCIRHITPLQHMQQSMEEIRRIPPPPIASSRCAYFYNCYAIF